MANNINTQPDAASSSAAASFDKETIEQVNRLLAQTGERERLKEMLRVRLMECGWHERVQTECLNDIKAKGIEHANPQELLATIIPKAKAIIPEAVRKELLQEISRFLESNLP